MVAYANPAELTDRRQRGDGYGIARWEFAEPGTGRPMPGALEFQCWPRFPLVGPDGKPRQFPGWPVVTKLPVD
jgi:hypothetical protein